MVSIFKEEWSKHAKSILAFLRDTKLFADLTLEVLDNRFQIHAGTSRKVTLVHLMGELAHSLQ